MTETKRSLAAAFRGFDRGGKTEAKALAALALRLARDGAAEAAWLVAERLCRIHPRPSADMLALRAVMARAAGDPQQARHDLAAALALQPRHASANLAAIRFGDDGERDTAALRLLRPATPIGLLRQAVAALLGGGHPAVAAVAADRSAINGFACWRKGAAPLLAVSFDGGPERPFRLRADARHRLAGQDRLAAPIQLVWPRGTQSARITGNIAVTGSELWRPEQVTDAPAAPTPVAAPPPPRSIAIVVPVFQDPAATRACFAWLGRRDAHPPSRVIAVDDATPEPEIASLLDTLAENGRLTLIRNASNAGFAASVNRALETVAPDEDVLLLNADAFLPPSALARLQRAAYANPNIGTATPLSNNGEDMSVPARFHANPLPDAAGILAADAAAAHANSGHVVTVPNGIGFCLYLRRDALAAAGPLSLGFGRGYYEDVDLCLRMARLGFRNVAAADAYVGHAGAASFGADKRLLVTDNQERLAALHPDYRATSAAFQRDDPLKEAAAQFEAVRLAEAKPFRIALAPASRIAGVAPYVTDAKLAAVSRNGGIALTLMADATYPTALTLRHGAGDAVGLAGDLAGLPVERLLLADPHLLPVEVVLAAERIERPLEVLFTAAGAGCARAGLATERGPRTCCNGWCPLELSCLSAHSLAAPPLRRLVDRAVAVSASTDALAATLRDLAPTIAVATFRTSPAAAPPTVGRRSARPPRLAILAPNPREPLLLVALTAALRKAVPAIEIAVLGETGDDGRHMTDPAVFCLGATGGSEWPRLLHRIDPDLCVTLDRLGVEGDPHAEALVAGVRPLARFLWGARISGGDGDGLTLRPDASAGEAARRIAAWAALRLTGDERVDRKERALIEPEAGRIDLGRGRIEIESEA